MYIYIVLWIYERSQTQIQLTDSDRDPPMRSAFQSFRSSSSEIRACYVAQMRHLSEHAGRKRVSPVLTVTQRARRSKRPMASTTAPIETTCTTQQARQLNRRRLPPLQPASCAPLLLPPPRLETHVRQSATAAVTLAVRQCLHWYCWHQRRPGISRAAAQRPTSPPNWTAPPVSSTAIRPGVTACVYARAQTAKGRRCYRFPASHRPARATKMLAACSSAG